MKAHRWFPAALVALAACTSTKAPPTALSSATPSATAALASPTPAAFAPLDILDVAFGTPEVGWAVGAAATGADGIFFARTTDGGASWSTPVLVTTAPADRPNGATVRFSDANNGWVSGPFGLFATKDGGTTWARAAAVTGTVGAVAPAGSSAWVLDDPCASGSACTPVLLESTVGQAVWRRAVVQPQLTTELAGLLRVSATNAFLVVSSRGGPPVPWQHTADGGASWQPFADPCGQLGGFGDAPATLDGITIWVACAGEPSAGSELKQVLVSSDAGRSWQVRASTGGFAGGPAARGTLPEGGYISDLLLLSPTVGLMSLSRGGVLRSTDGGRNWSEIALPGVAFGETFPIIWVLDGTHAWVVTGNGSSGAPQPFRTTDGGVTWASEAAVGGGQRSPTPAPAP